MNCNEQKQLAFANVSCDVDLKVKAPFKLGGVMKAQGDELKHHGTHIWIRSTLTPLVSENGRGLTEYEADSDEEIGGTGLAIELYNKMIEIVIREWSEEAIDGIATNRVTIEFPEEIALTDNFTDFLIYDDGKEIKVSFDNKLMCTIEYSGETDGYYNNAVVKDPEGNVILESNSATLCADVNEASVAFSNRAGVFTLDEVYYIGNYSEGKNVYTNKSTYTTEDDINIGYVGATEKDWIGIYKKGTTPSNENNPIKRIEAAGMGAETLKAVDLTLEAGESEVILFENNEFKEVSKVEIKVENPPTPEPTEQKEESTPTPSSTEDDGNDGGGNPLLFILIGVGALVVVAAVAIIILKRKK